MNKNFWKEKKLNQMNHEEWEALCSRCGICCLEKVEDQGQVFYSRVACQLFDNINCCCSNYENKHELVPECTALTAENLGDLKWLPPTCAYRCLAEGRELPEWHYLISDSHETVHTAGKSARGCDIYDPAIDFEEIQLYSLEESEIEESDI